MPYPPFLLVRQHFPSHRIADIPAEVRRQLDASGFRGRLKPGDSVAIGVGSRGIANIATIVHAAVDWWKQHGFAPFIFPAMGTHGAATARGQAAVLAKYGITDERMGCPIRSSLAVVELGETPEGIRTFLDRTASRAAGIMLCSRVKWHTDFEGKLESGLFKMMAIGLGKFAGAQRYHTHAYTMGLERVIRSVGRQVLASGKLLGGLAILEDGNHDTAVIEAVPAAAMEQREEQLLALVKTWMPTIPVKALDVLIVNEIGKTISGAGMDPKVVNRSVRVDYNPWPFAPRIERIFLRDLNDGSYGNATGIGMADVVHSRSVRKMKRRPTYVNGITANTLPVIRLPISFPTDRECLDTIWRTVGRFDLAQVAFGWIRNSQDLRLMSFSANLREEINTNPALEIVGAERALEFDAQGDLINWLA